MKVDAMTELTKQERDEAFITLVLTQEDAELYRRYGATTREEMDRSGIPDLSLKIESMFSKLLFAGLFDKNCPAPYEKRESKTTGKNLCYNMWRSRHQEVVAKAMTPTEWNTTVVSEKSEMCPRGSEKQFQGSCPSS